MTTAYQDVTITDDNYLDEEYPTYNYGTSTLLEIGINLTSSAYCYRALLKLTAPSKPAGADADAPSPRLRFYVTSGPGGNPIVQAWKISRAASTVIEGTGAGSATGDGATWGTYNGADAWTAVGGDMAEFLGLVSVGAAFTGWKEINIDSIGLGWGESAWVLLKFSVDTLGSGDVLFIASAENGTTTNRPVARWYYEAPAPTKITDLMARGHDSASPASDLGGDDAKLTWTANKDDDFARYELRRSYTSPVTYSSTLVATITDQSTSEYIYTGGLADGTAYYFALFVEDSENFDANATKSNEVLAISPAITAVTLSDTTPALFQSVSLSVTATAYPTVPISVYNTHVKIEWGESSDADLSGGWFDIGVLPRAHRYPYAGTQSVYVRLKNNLGFWCARRGITGNPITVSNLPPVARIRASPVLANTTEYVTFYGDESYCPAGNKTLAATGAYEWDKDYTGAFVADTITTVPVQTAAWTTAGTKVMALRVKDIDGTYSPAVTFSVAIIAPSTVDLDALVDGYDSEDSTDGRYTTVTDAMDMWDVRAGAEMPKTVALKGCAYTDSDADGIPDDIATLRDIALNNKRVSLTWMGTTHTGVLKGEIRTSRAAGADDQYDWACTVVLST